MAVLNRPKVTRKLRAVAYHEAGHAVASFLLDQRFGVVTIIPKGNTLGCVMSRKFRRAFLPDCDTGDYTRVRAERYILGLLAGHEAERIHTGRSNHVGAGSDDAEAFNLAAYFTRSDDELVKYVVYLRARVRGLLRNRWAWKAVRSLAHGLLKERRMNEARAREYIHKGYALPKDEQPALDRPVSAIGEGGRAAAEVGVARNG
jgi:hypothetical protein